MITHTRYLLNLLIEVYPYCDSHGKDRITFELKRIFKDTDVNKRLKKQECNSLHADSCTL